MGTSQPGRAREPRFAPDFFVVFDVEPGPRTSFIVDHEGKGLDFVLEIHASGDRAKDLATNVDRYARLNIPEYFVFDVGHQRIHGWRQGARPGTYVPVLPQGGRWRADHLGAELGIVDTRLRFFVDAAMLPLESELRSVLSSALDAALERAEAEAARAAEASRHAEEETRRAEDEARRAEDEFRRAEEEARHAADEFRRAEDESRRAEEEARRADALAAENAELRATLARLRGETPRD